jgi:hypothetical protein
MDQLFIHLTEAGIECREDSNSVITAGSCLSNSDRLLLEKRLPAEKTDEGQ